MKRNFSDRDFKAFTWLPYDKNFIGFILKDWKYQNKILLLFAN